MAGEVTRFEELARALRTSRAFAAPEVLAAKVGRLQRWFGAEKLDAAVVGVSGGVDSAVTLALLQAAAAPAGSPLRRVVAVLIPIAGPGATEQERAATRASLAADACGAERWLCPFTDAQEAARRSLEAGSGLTTDGWAAGQLLSVMRTPALYGAAALLRRAGHAAVVVGTTNRDEGAYLGFFGKASDAMVDLQPLSDLHKSEVVALARLLGVPAKIIDAAPAGDVWDGRDDEAMIGATYDEIEVVLRLRELGRDPVAVAAALVDGERLRLAATAVDGLHRRNAHKYAVGSPAVHLDILPRAVPGGWSDTPLAGRGDPGRPEGPVPGAWGPPVVTLDPCGPHGGRGPLPRVDELAAGVLLAHDVLTARDCDMLVTAMTTTAAPEPVGVSGRTDCEDLGSVRATAWSRELAGDLWTRLAPAVPAVCFLGPLDATDGFATATRAGHRTWRLVGLSPLLRFMRYETGGRHRGHYDAGFDHGDGRRTLLSAVFFLTDAAPHEGGSTRLLVDGQEHVPVWARDHDDWDRDAAEDEVRLAIRPERGAVLVFPHRTCHDVQRWGGTGPRIIVRADIVYEAVPDGRMLP